MDGTTRWTVAVDIRHVGGMTYVGARLHGRGSADLVGRGIVMADADGADPQSAVEALAAAHALADLAARLRRRAADQATPSRPSP